MAHATNKKTATPNPHPSDLNAKGLKDSAVEIQSDLKVGQTDAALVKADGVIKDVKASVAKNGVEKTVAIAVKAGASQSQGQGLIDFAMAEPEPPSGMVRAMIQRAVSERQLAVRLAVCSVETSRWVDGLAETNKPEARRNQKELIAEALASGDPFTCLMLAARMATRQVRAEFITKLALYSLSTAFVLDAKAHDESEQVAHAAQLRELFIGMEKILDGTATKAEKKLFSKALAARIEVGLDLPQKSVWRLMKAGPDALAKLPMEGTLSVTGVGYGTADDSADKAVATAGTIRRDYSKLRKVGGLIRMFFVGCPIVLGDAKRMLEDGEKLAALAPAMAKLQVAQTLLTTAETGIVERMLAGKLIAEGLYFSTGKPVEIGADLFEETKLAIEEVVLAGYPANTGRGREIWATVLGTLNGWMRNWPETFPWFENKEMQAWFSQYPHKLRDEKIDILTDGVAAYAKHTREEAIALAEERRQLWLVRLEEEAAKDPKLTDAARSKMEQQHEEASSMYPEGSTSRRALDALRNADDAEGIRLVAEEGANPRKVRGRKA